MTTEFKGVLPVEETKDDSRENASSEAPLRSPDSSTNSRMKNV